MQEAKKFIGFDKKVKTSVIGLFIVILLFVISSIWVFDTQKGINYPIDPLIVYKTPKQNDLGGIITAYNLVSWQTDSTPCIGAYNDNICQLVEQGVNVVANNCLEQGTEIEIEGVGRFVVLDKMNSRYGCEHFDIAMAQDQVVEAIQFGRQNRNIIIK